MAHVQGAGDVRRRDDDREWLRPGPLRPPGPERTGLLPGGRDAALDRLRVERLVHHGIMLRSAPAHFSARATSGVLPKRP